MLTREEVKNITVIIEKVMAFNEKIKGKEGKTDIPLLDLKKKPVNIAGVDTIGLMMDRILVSLCMVATSISEAKRQQDYEKQG